MTPPLFFRLESPSDFFLTAAAARSHTHTLSMRHVATHTLSNRHAHRSHSPTRRWRTWRTLATSDLLPRLLQSPQPRPTPPHMHLDRFISQHSLSLSLKPPRDRLVIGDCVESRPSRSLPPSPPRPRPRPTPCSEYEEDAFASTSHDVHTLMWERTACTSMELGSTA